MTKRALFTAAFLITLLPLMGQTEPKAGSYLAARQAAMNNDFEASARLFTQSLTADPLNPYLLENTVISYLGLRDFERAAPVAKMMLEAGISSQMANLTLSVDAAYRDDWDAVLAGITEGRSIGPLVDGLTTAWGYVGKGQMSLAIDAFDVVIKSPGLSAYGLYNKALALAHVGDFEGAEAIFADGSNNGMRYNRRSALVHAQLLSQLGRAPEAITLLDAVFGTQTDPTLVAMRTALAASDTLAFDYVRNAKDGLSEVYLMLAQAVTGDADDDYVLLYARAASWLNPENTDAILLSAELLDNMQQYDLAAEAFSQISAESPAFQSAELGRAETLRKAGKSEAAIEVLEALARAFPDMPRVHATAGDTYREAGQLEKAKAAYSRALDLYDETDPLKWFIYYARGITNHSLDDWPATESDFRAALALNPDQPQVLNYLGYSMVERNINMDEALVMIETAVAAEPQNGAIVDSLGWVLFQRGDYENAVVHLENAAALEPVDPVVNDHLGDALWAVGRVIEARFQWNRALSFDPTEADAARIRRKLDVGLDAVRVEEGAPPLHTDL